MIVSTISIRRRARKKGGRCTILLFLFWGSAIYWYLYLMRNSIILHNFESTIIRFFLAMGFYGVSCIWGCPDYVTVWNTETCIFGMWNSKPKDWNQDRKMRDKCIRFVSAFRFVAIWRFIEYSHTASCELFSFLFHPTNPGHSKNMTKWNSVLKWQYYYFPETEYMFQKMSG